MKTRKLRLVLGCLRLATELVRLAVALWNMAINYASGLSFEPEVV
jgi:hypothetical protein